MTIYECVYIYIHNIDYRYDNQPFPPKYQVHILRHLFGMMILGPPTFQITSQS